MQRTGRPNTVLRFDIFDPADEPASVSPFAHDAWAWGLRAYPDQSYVAAVLGAIRHGLRVGYRGPLRETGRPCTTNLPMDDRALDHVRSELVDRGARGEVRRWDTIGPLTTSPVGTVGKSNGKLRTIHHLSWPRHGDRLSVNNGIDIEWVTLQYETLDKLFNDLRAAHERGESVQLWKADLADAFRHCVVAKSDAILFGLSLDGELYFDTRLPFGCRSSPFLFNLYSEGLHWMADDAGVDCSHYLDDFFGIHGHPQAALDAFCGIARRLGFTLRDEKLELGVRIEILGILVDTERCTASITETRRRRYVAAIDDVLDNGAATAIELSTIAGCLIFTTRICPPGKAFLRSIYDAAGEALQFAGKRRLPHTAVQDLKWWRNVLRDWDGIMYLNRPRPDREIWSDASTTKGYGGHLGPQEAPLAAWQAPIPDELQGKDIMLLEALALLESLRRWQPDLAGCSVRCYVDNSVLFSALRSGSCRHRPTQGVIRAIFELAMTADVQILPHWIPSAENKLADVLSRLSLDDPTLTPAILAMLDVSHDNRPSLLDSTSAEPSRVVV